MDVYTHVVALVGVIATGEVRLWKHSQDHLRFLHCDFMHEIEKGENYWIARRQQFYEERGLLYLPQRMLPRDLDDPRSRFAVSKEYLVFWGPRSFQFDLEMNINIYCMHYIIIQDYWRP